MYLTGQSSPTVDQLLSRIHSLSQALLADFSFSLPLIKVGQIDDLAEQFDRQQLYLVNDGMLHIQRGEQTLASFDEGDLVGFHNAFDLPAPTLSSEEYIELQPINRDELLRHIYSDKRRQHYWSHYLVSHNALLLHYLSNNMRSQPRPSAGFQNVSRGEVIIRQGDKADHVYTIIHGQADVFVDEVKVGEIGEEEVFGAMAVFTREPRSATVIARTSCTLMAVPQEDFVLLIEAQPKAAVNLIENLARRISALNQQLVER